MPLNVLRPRLRPFSPVTTITSSLSGSAPYETEVTVSNPEAFPSPGSGEVAFATLCADQRFASNDPTDYEVISFTGKNGNDLTGVARGVEGVIQAWAANTSFITCVLTESYLEKIWDEIEHIHTKYDALMANMLGNMCGAMVKTTSVKAVPTNENYDVDWDEAIFDTHGFWSTGANSDKLIIPHGLGIRKVVLGCGLDFSGEPLYNAAIRVNWRISPAIAGQPSRNLIHLTNNDGDLRRIGGSSAIVNVEGGSEIQLRIWHNYGDTRNLEAVNTHMTLQVLERDVL